MTDRPLFIRLSLPNGLEEILEGLAKEVLRKKPADIYEFAADHFEELLKRRNGDEEDYYFSPHTPCETKFCELSDAKKFGRLNTPDITVEALESPIEETSLQDESEVKRIFNTNSLVKRKSIDIQLPTNDSISEDYEIRESKKDYSEDNSAKEPLSNERCINEREEEDSLKESLSDQERLNEKEEDFLNEPLSKEPCLKETEDEEDSVKEPLSNEQCLNEEEGKGDFLNELNSNLECLEENKDEENSPNKSLFNKQYLDDTGDAEDSLNEPLSHEECHDEKRDKEDSPTEELSDELCLDAKEGNETLTDTISSTDEKVEVKDETEEVLPPCRESSKAVEEIFEGKELEGAATKLQAGFRGYKTRKRLRDVRKKEESMLDNDILSVEEAATIVQARFIGDMSRKFCKEKERHRNTGTCDENNAKTVEISGYDHLDDGAIDQNKTEKYPTSSKLQSESIVKDECDKEKGMTDQFKNEPIKNEEEIAATTVQSVYRGYRVRRDLSHNDRIQNEINLSNDTNDPKEYVNYFQEKDDKLESGTIEMSKANAIISPDLAATYIQAFCKGQKARERYKEISANNYGLEQAATTVQAQYKSYITRQKLEEESGIEIKDIPKKSYTINDQDKDIAATRIQAEFKGYNEKQKFIGSNADVVRLQDDQPSSKELELSATKIQAQYKGYKVRKALENRDEETLPHENQKLDLSDDESHLAASKIQAQYRGFKVRQELEANSSKIEGMKESGFKNLEPNINDDESNLAATKIQAKFKGFKVRQALKANSLKIKDVEEPGFKIQEPNNKEDENSLAATKIQAKYRGFKVRQELKADSSKIKAIEDLSSKNQELNLNDEESNLAATRIQGQYRGFKVRQELEANSSKIRNIEEPDNENQDQNTKDNESSLAATKIQAQYRGFKARQELEANCLKIKDFEKADQDKNTKDNESSLAATEIQAQYRGFKVRQEMDTNSSEIKSNEEPCSESKMADVNNKESSLAATKIQAQYRGFKARQGLKSNSFKIKDIQEQDLENQKSSFKDRENSLAATKIQAQYRGFKVRQELEAHFSKIKDIKEQVLKSQKPSLNYEESNLAATKIQAQYRGFKERQELDVNSSEIKNTKDPLLKNQDQNTNNEESTLAATKIQAQYRGFKTRQELEANSSKIINIEEPGFESEDQNTNHNDSSLAATKIQAHYRGYKTRQYFNDNSSKIIDNKEPDFENQKPDLCKDVNNLAATKIQAQYRGYKTRQNFDDNSSEIHNTESALSNQQILDSLDELNVAATQIQANFKSFKVRKELEKKSQSKNAPPVVSANLYQDHKLTKMHIEPLEKIIKTDKLGEIDNSATTIQAGYRGYMSRKNYRRAKEGVPKSTANIDISDNDLELEVTKIQAMYRGHATRKKLNKKEENQTINLSNTIQDKVVAELPSSSIEFEKEEIHFEQKSDETVISQGIPVNIDEISGVDLAATQLQAGYKGLKAREERVIAMTKKDHIINVREFEESLGFDEAASVLQRGYKGYLTRRKFDKKKSEGANKTFEKSDRSLSNQEPAQPERPTLNEDKSELWDSLADTDDFNFQMSQNAETLIQGKFIADDDRLNYISDENEKDLAVTKIQALCKGHRVREQITERQIKQINEAKGNLMSEASDHDTDGVDESNDKKSLPIKEFPSQSNESGINEAQQALVIAESESLNEKLKSPLELVEEDTSQDNKQVIKTFNQSIGHNDENKSGADKKNAATCIQAGCKGHMARKQELNLRIQRLKENDNNLEKFNMKDISKTNERTVLKSDETDNAIEDVTNDANTSDKIQQKENKNEIEPTADETATNVKKEDQAATMIQSGLKGFNVRNLSGAKKLAEANKSEDIINEKDLISVENVIEEDEFIPDNHIIFLEMKIRTIYRVPSEEMYEDHEFIAFENYGNESEEELNAAASKLQANFRGYKVRKELKGPQIKHDAATVIQANFKRYSALQKFKKKLRLKSDLTAAKIQAKHRGGYNSKKNSPKEKTDNRKEVIEIPFEEVSNISEVGALPFKSQQDIVIVDVQDEDSKPSPIFKIRLYHYRDSTDSQKVLMYLYERKIDFSGYHLDMAEKENYGDWYLKLTPTGEIPTMVFNELDIVSSSSNIIEFLESNIPVNLYPPPLIPCNTDLNLYPIYQDCARKIQKIPLDLISEGIAFHPELSDKTPYNEPEFSKIRNDVRNLSNFLMDTVKTCEEPSIQNALKSKADAHKSVMLNLTEIERFKNLLNHADSMLDEIENYLTDGGWILGNFFSVADIYLAVLINRFILLGNPKRILSNRKRLRGFFQLFKLRKPVFEKTIHLVAEVSDIREWEQETKKEITWASLWK